MRRYDDHKLNEILSVLDVNVFELMNLPIETLGYQLIHERGVSLIKRSINSMDLNKRAELYSKLGSLLSTQLKDTNYIEYREVFSFASVVHCSLPYEERRTQQHTRYFDQLNSFDLEPLRYSSHLKKYESFLLFISKLFECHPKTFDLLTPSGSFFCNSFIYLSRLILSFS